ncbi:MAG: hypothetical protein ABI175_27390, partial [Polyangiales bacterium]
ESPQDDASRIRDEKAETIYEQLAEGATAADAGVIASELAQQIKDTEQRGLTLSGQIPIMTSEEAQAKRTEELEDAVDSAVESDTGDGTPKSD